MDGHTHSHNIVLSGMDRKERGEQKLSLSQARFPIRSRPAITERRCVCPENEEEGR